MEKAEVKRYVGVVEINGKKIVLQDVVRRLKGIDDYITKTSASLGSQEPTSYAMRVGLQFLDCVLVRIEQGMLKDNPFKGLETVRELPEVEDAVQRYLSGQITREETVQRLMEFNELYAVHCSEKYFNADPTVRKEIRDTGVFEAVGSILKLR